MAAPLRVLAEISRYSDFPIAFRRRVDELGLTREEIDRLSGLCDGYSAKLLCLPPMKRMGFVSFDPMVGTLGVKFLMIEDPDQTAKILARMTPRERPILQPKSKA